jgi:hypothetical protein
MFDVDEKDKVYVVVGSYLQAKSFSEEQGHDLARIAIVDRSYKVMGIKRGTKLFVYGTASNLESFQDIMREAQIRGLDIHYV